MLSLKTLISFLWHGSARDERRRITTRPPKASLAAELPHDSAAALGCIRGADGVRLMHQRGNQVTSEVSAV